MRTIDVAIIEDQHELREGLRDLVDGSPGFRCSGRFRTMEEALEGLHEGPQVALVDIGLPGMSGIEGVRRLRERFPATATLMLSVYDDDERVFDALCAGASGYLLKKTAPARLLEGIAEVAAGGAPMSPEIARRVIQVFRDIRPPARVETALTPHEQRVLQLLADGHNYKTAGVELGVSAHTISFHMRRTYDKLQVHSKSDAVAKALRHGLIK